VVRIRSGLYLSLLTRERDERGVADIVTLSLSGPGDFGDPKFAK